MGERDLQQQIKKMNYMESGDQKSIMEDIDSDSDISSLEMEEDEEEHNGSLKLNDDKANDFKDDRRPSNLFRAQSRKLWNTEDLDEQENALKEHMRMLSGENVIGG